MTQDININGLLAGSTKLVYTVFGGPNSPELQLQTL